ncbi:isoprenyl transferase [Marinoscillum furvescens]|uniref:Isoprenyl transferase n=1 Tax=Marinoscillum furvescens DSM 4134 TaxID=1122208 RepID=A0A3D9L847_MARFU|nr:isoprenyl transferase [Marinoscillum furvescens]REE01683.1 undecaprenyl diphosphate synthase [Marinoscillum furvescens DSM 4134]
MKEQIKQGNLPQHIAVIMDGNGRWAKKQGAARIFGHRNAIKAVRDVTEGCAELGIGYLTLYAFSTENWSRPKQEVQGLMTLLVATINDEVPTLMKNNIRLKSIGDTSKLPNAAQKKLAEAISKTADNTGLTLNLALNYSGKWDLTQAMNKIATQLRAGDTHDEITPELIEKNLSTAGMPDPELLIRTSGEMRISNFLLWQLAYTELFFTPVLWPDFRKEHLHEGISSYQQRERRFGKISEQVNA